MNVHGRVLAVTEELAGDFAEATINVGDISITLSDATDFLEGGGFAVIDPDGDDGGPLTIQYQTADFDFDTLTIIGTVTQAFPAGTVVRVTPPYTVTVAYVQPDDPEMPPIAARVPYAMRPTLPLGQRSEVLGEDETSTEGIEEVVVELVRGSWVIQDILGIDPGVIDVHSDGVPPSDSPVPIVEGGIGALFIKWDAIPNPDPVRYEVHVSLQPDFIPDASTFAGEIDGTQFVVHALPQSTAPPDPPPSGTTNGTMAMALPSIRSSAAGAIPVPPPTQTDFANWFDCGTAAAAITTINSGGGNGDAFTNVNTGPGSIVFDSGALLAQGLNAKMTASAGGTGGQYVGWTTSSTWHELWLRAYFELPSSSGRRDLIQVLSGTNQCFLVCVTLAGLIQIRDAAGAIITTGSVFWTPAAPVRLEVHAILDATQGHIEVALIQALPTDEAVDEVVGDFTTNVALFGTTANVARFGNLTASVGGGEVCYVDNPAVSTVDWIGP